MIPNSILLKMVTRELKKALNLKELNKWILVLEYDKDELYFLIDKKKIYADQFKESIGNFLRIKYAELEDQEGISIIGCKISYENGESKSSVYYLNSVNEKKVKHEKL